jgi:hypothetical protein
MSLVNLAPPQFYVGPPRKLRIFSVRACIHHNIVQSERSFIFLTSKSLTVPLDGVLDFQIMSELETAKGHELNRKNLVKRSQKKDKHLFARK